MVLRLRYPPPEGLVEAGDQVRYRRRNPRHRQADNPARDRLALNLPCLSLRDISVACLFEDRPERCGDAVGIRLSDEDRVLAVEVLDVIYLVPPFGDRVRRGVTMAVQD